MTIMVIGGFSVISLLLGAVILLVGTMLANRRSGNARRRYFTIGVFLALGAILVSVVSAWVLSVVSSDGVVRNVPAILATLISVAGASYVAAGLGSRPGPTEAQSAESRLFGFLADRVTGVFVAVSLCALGLFLGVYVDEIGRDQLSANTVAACVATAFLLLVTLLMPQVRAAGRPTRADAGLPPSAEFGDASTALVDKVEALRHQLDSLFAERSWRNQPRQDGIRGHRFPERLMDPQRSIRVLVVTADGTARLERIPSTTLLQSRSAVIISEVDGAESARIAASDETHGDMPAAGAPMVGSLIQSDLTALRISGFDGFEPVGGEAVYVVAHADDDYTDFPDGLGAAASCEASG